MSLTIQSTAELPTSEDLLRKNWPQKQEPSPAANIALVTRHIHDMRKAIDIEDLETLAGYASGYMSAAAQFGGITRADAANLREIKHAIHEDMTQKLTQAEVKS